MATRFVARPWSRVFFGYAGMGENGKPPYGVTTNKIPVFSVSRVSRLMVDAKNINTASVSWLRSGIRDTLYTMNLFHHDNSAREPGNVVPVEASNAGRVMRFLYWRRVSPWEGSSRERQASETVFWYEITMPSGRSAAPGRESGSPS